MQPTISPDLLAKAISIATKLEFRATTGVDGEGQHWYLLQPRGTPANHGFGIRVILGWRRLWIDFEPGKFAATLLADMGKAEPDGQSAFCAVLNDSVSRGANIELEINGARLAYDSEELWTAEWKRIVLTMSKGLLELGVDQGEWDWHIVSDWTKRFAAAIIAILPLEASGVYGLEVAGFPEGALTAVQMNRYERDPRNRAAAVALHGTACAGCGLELKSKYGPIAESLIEVHHVTPVSQLGAGYVIDPMHDLVPLCPNCHAVVHRQVPPLTIGELRQLLDCDFREVEVCAPREGGDSG